jgi:hypothetical protein
MSRHRGPAGPVRPRWITFLGALVATIAILVSSAPATTAAAPPAPVEPPAIYILAPAGTSTYGQDDSVEVVWRTGLVDEGEFGVWVLGPRGDKYAETIRPPQPSGARWESLPLALKGVPDGAGYRVVIAWRSTIGSGAWQQPTTSPGSFTVTGGIPHITITAPTGTGVHLLGAGLRVSWTTATAVSEGEFGVWVTPVDGGKEKLHSFVTPPPYGRTDFYSVLYLNLPRGVEYRAYVAYRSVGYGPWQITVPSPGTFSVTTERPVNDITAFSIKTPSGEVFNGGIDQRQRTIQVFVPDETDVTALVATFTTQAARVTVGGTTQVSGVTPNDFTYPVTYTATDKDGSKLYYTVRVSLSRRVWIGKEYGGGLVAYIYKKGDPGFVEGEYHGLIAATADQPVAVPWALPSHLKDPVNGTSQAIGSGYMNTLMIVNQNGPGTGYAAGLARAYDGGGHKDWFLPSFREFQVMAQSKGVLHLKSVSYWTSTEAQHMRTSAWFMSLMDPRSFGDKDKSFLLFVRPVRRF